MRAGGAYAHSAVAIDEMGHSRHDQAEDDDACRQTVHTQEEEPL